MKIRGWVGGLIGVIVLCGTIMCGLAGFAACLLFDGSSCGHGGEFGTGAWVRMAAAADGTGLELPAPVVAGDDREEAAQAAAMPAVEEGTGPAGKEAGRGAGAPPPTDYRPPLGGGTTEAVEPPADGLEEFAVGAVEPSEGPSPEPFGEDESVLLNFERGDIREVIHSLATALGLSYMIDPKIQGQVTIRTIGRIPKEHLFPVFNRILRNNGIAAIEVGGIYQIVPVEEAKTRAILPPSAATRAQLEAADSFVIEIISVTHVAAEEMVGVLEPFVTPGGDIFAYARGNLLIVTDLDSNVERLRELAAALDTDAFRGMRTRAYKIENGDLDIIVEELAALLASYGHSIDGSTGVSLIPMSRLETLTCISYDPAVFDQIARWLQVLDVKPEEGAGRTVYVYRVENAKAADLAEILNELFGEGGGTGRGGLQRGGAFGETRGAFGRPTATSRGGLTGGGLARPLAQQPQGGATALRQRSGSIDAVTAEQRSQDQTPMIEEQLSQNQPLGLGATRRATGAQAAGGAGSRAMGGLASRRSARGDQAVTGGAVGVVLPGGRQAAGGMLGGISGPPPVFKEEVRIVADEVTNSLVILAVKQDYEKVLEVLKEIDVVPRQVVIEVMIAEVTLDKGMEWGVDHALRFWDGLEGSVSAVRNLGAGAVSAGEGEDVPLGDKLFALADPGSGGLAAFITDKDRFAIILRALANRSMVKILSAPHIIAADNREAHIQVGSSVPILTGTSTSVLTATSTVVNQIQYRDVGTILTILPQVNSAGLVNMQVSQEVSKVGAEDFGKTNSPSFLTREAETTVVVQDGDSVLIGGIIDEQNTMSRKGVPFIMEIPVFGRLFRADRATKTRTELLVLITPHVILNREQALAVTDEFKQVIHGLDRLLQQRRGSEFTDEDEERHLGQDDL